MSRLRVGVVGVGHLGRHHARVLAGLDGVELVGVADARIEQARAVAGPLGVEATADYRTLLDRVDAVSIAVPTSLHHEVACAFLDRRIPAMVEKPLAAGVAEAEAIVALAEARGVVLQVGHIERFNPALAALDGVRLRPKFITAERLGLYTFRSTDIGVVFDLMIHDLDLILDLVDSPVLAVSAVGVSLFGRHEDVANARIWFEDGCVAEVTASRASPQVLRKMRLWGLEGYASLDFAGRSGQLVRPSERFRPGGLDLDGVELTQPASVKAHLFGKVFRLDPVPPPAEGRDPLTMELEDFVAAVRDGRRPRVSGHDALRAVRLAQLIVEGLESHQWEGTAEGPVGPRAALNHVGHANAGLPQPKLWRYHAHRSESARARDEP